jgi:hypothetical protein
MDQSYSALIHETSGHKVGTHDVCTWQLDTIEFCCHSYHSYQREEKGGVEISALDGSLQINTRGKEKEAQLLGMLDFENRPFRGAVGGTSLLCVLFLLCSISLFCGHCILEQEHKKRIYYNQTERQRWKHHRIQNQSVS